MAGVVTAEFTNLPLVDVRLMIRSSAGDLRMDFDSLRDIREEVRGDFPVLQDLEAESGPNVLQITSGGGPGLECFSEDRALSCSARKTLLEVRWRKVGPSAYPRYGALADFLARIVPHVKGTLDITTIAYANLIEIEGLEHIGTYASLPVTFDPSYIKELNIARNVQYDGCLYEFRVQAGKASESAWLFTTSSGTRSERPPLAVLKEVHDACNVSFLALLTDHAKQRWGYHSL